MPFDFFGPIHYQQFMTSCKMSLWVNFTALCVLICRLNCQMKLSHMENMARSVFYPPAHRKVRARKLWLHVLYVIRYLSHTFYSFFSSGKRREKWCSWRILLSLPIPRLRHLSCESKLSFIEVPVCIPLIEHSSCYAVCRVLTSVGVEFILELWIFNENKDKLDELLWLGVAFTSILKMQFLLLGSEA